MAKVLKLKLISAGIDDDAASFKSGMTIFEYSQNREVQFVDEQLWKTLPKIVEPKGRGSKQFITTWSPFQFHAKGFSFLGINVTWFACHSIVASYRFLSQKHSGNPKYLNHLYNTAKSCSSAHILNIISIDQPVLASTILSKLGVIKK